jgi:hypothetical protein
VFQGLFTVRWPESSCGTSYKGEILRLSLVEVIFLMVTFSQWWKPIYCKCSAWPKVSVTVRNWRQQHMRTVWRKLSFSCSFKNNFSVVLCNLKVSLRNLTGEEPCSCFHCSKFLAQLHALNYHLETQFEKREPLCVILHWYMWFNCLVSLNI